MVGNLGSRAKKMRDSIVIVDSSVEFEEKFELINDVTKGKLSSPLTIINSIKKREDSFKAEIWAAIKHLLVEVSGKGVLDSFSLEDLQIYLKGSSAVSRSGKLKNITTKSSSRMEQIRCHVTNPLLPVEIVGHLRKGLGSSGQIVHVEEISERMAVHVEFPYNLLETTALQRIGISRLYTHQEESIWVALSGKNVVVATSTSSGKSLCYNIPVLEVLPQNL